ncbi:MAG: mucoidy inhibitor MuiA family protein [Deltaproteobacteria bacterium]|nr:mucoidy inhibitor MuiA family protein [Deltaproteobacteria bacterium]
MEHDQTPRLQASVPVVEVTVQEDRALVRREGMVSLPPGRSRLRIDAVAPVLVDKSLTATVQHTDEAEGTARVLGARAVRWRVTQQSQQPAAVAALATQRREHEAELATLTRQEAAVTSERTQLSAMLDLSLAELGQDAGWGALDAEAGHRTLDAVGQRLAALGDERCTLAQQRQRLQQRIADLAQLESAALSTEASAAAALDLTFDNPAATATTVQLRVDYLVAGALWRPWHRARLVEAADGATVEFQCEACVWQATGEDWNDAQIVLSTERPSLGLSPPTLQTDMLGLRKKGAAVEVQTRQQEIQQAGLGGDGDEPHTETEQLPGIDDGGEVQRLRGRGHSTIPGDGRPHRVPLFSFTSPADVGLRCVPEEAAAVVLRSEQANRARHPILAGPVDLMRGSGRVGRTSLLYIAPGERFELGWGPDAALRVSREVEHLEHERKTLSSWTRKPRRVTIKLSNLDGAPRSVEIRERIAVSEIDKVEVELRSAEPPASADDDGFVTWDVTLQGLGRATAIVAWVLVVHDDVQGL